MTRGKRSFHEPRGLGRHHAYDPRNEDYRIRDVVPSASVRSLGTQAVPRVSRRWNDTAWFGDQLKTPQCTAYGMLHLIADGPVTHPRANPLIDPAILYEENRAVDRAEGRVFDEGATVLAAAKAATKRGWIGEYRWGYTIDELVAAVLDVGPVVVGVNWYESWFTPYHDGRMPALTGAIAGGHCFEINAANRKTKILRAKNSWGRETWGLGGRFYPTFAQMEQLIEEDGEILLARELPTPKVPG